MSLVNKDLEDRLRPLFRHYKVMFAFTFLCGLFAHSFVFTNIVHNNDNAYAIPGGYGTGISSGRWLLEVIRDVFPQFWGGMQNTTAFNGVFSLLILTVCACMTARLFSMEDKLEGWLWGAVFVCFPTVTSMFFYMYTAPLYSLAILMSVGAVYVADRYRHGWIAGLLLSGASMGIYQAFFPLTASLLVLLVLRSVMDREETIRSLISRALRFAALLVGALAAYLLALKAFLVFYHATLSDYRGINQTARFMGWRATYEIIKAEYKNFLLLPLQDYMGVTCTRAIRFALIVMAVLTVAALIWTIIRCGTWLRRLLLLACLAVFPFTVNAILLMCPNAEIYTLMEYALVTVFLAPLTVMARIRLSQEGSVKDRFTHFYLGRGRSLLAAAYVLLILNYSWLSAVNYTSMYYTTEQTASFATTLITQVKSLDGYSPDLPWAFIGKGFKSDDFYSDWGTSLGVMRLGGNLTSLLNRYSTIRFFQSYTGYHIDYAGDEVVAELMQNEQVQNMPVYPKDGSIAIVDGVIVIRTRGKLS